MAELSYEIALKWMSLELTNDQSTLVQVVEIGLVPPPGPRLNIKTVLSTYGDFHVKDKTAVRTSYL